MKKKWKNPGRRTEYDGLYQSWKCMLQRAGNKCGNSPTYSDVTVDPRWLSYDNFFEDMSDTWWESATLDKDIIKPGNRIYCPGLCKWVSRSDNSKEMHIRYSGDKAISKRIDVRKKISNSKKGMNSGINSHLSKAVIDDITNMEFACAKDYAIFINRSPSTVRGWLEGRYPFPKEFKAYETYYKRS